MHPNLDVGGLNMNKWSIGKAALLGAAFGIAYTAYRALSGSGGEPGWWVGLLLGAVIGGAILFVAVAAIRNAVARA
jgi:hypothetical protein